MVYCEKMWLCSELSSCVCMLITSACCSFSVYFFVCILSYTSFFLVLSLHFYSFWPLFVHFAFDHSFVTNSVICLFNSSWYLKGQSHKNQCGLQMSLFSKRQQWYYSFGCETHTNRANTTLSWDYLVYIWSIYTI